MTEYRVPDNFSVDIYLSRQYVGSKYTCSEFARDVWFDLTGEDLAERLKGLFLWESGRRVGKAEYCGFRLLTAPESPCIALMRRRHTVPHMGVYLRRRILHLTERRAFFHRPEIAAMSFTSLRYYR